MASEAMPSLAIEADSQQDDLEGRDPVLLRGPVRPLAGDVDRHNSIRMPYRSWCEVCGQAGGKEDPHLRNHGETVEEHGGKLHNVS